MGHHCCSCDCHKVIVNCAPGLTPQVPPPPEAIAPPPGPSTPQPTPPARCTRVQVRITAIEIGAGGEWTGAHWRLPMLVNGTVVGTFDQDGVYDGHVFPLGFVHTVDISGSGSTVEIRAAGGEEFDWGFWDPDDNLPDAVRTHSESDNWGIGSNSLSGADDEFSYVLRYTISCVERSVVSFVTRTEVVSYMRVSAKKRGTQVRPVRTEQDILADDNLALRYFLQKMGRKGLSVRDVASDILVFEGDRSIREFVREPVRNPKGIRKIEAQKSKQSG